MKDKQVSRTAQFAAIYRAYHSINDNPKIFDDFLAASILEEGEMASFQQQMVATMKSYNPQLAASFPNEASIVAFMMQSMAATPQILSRARYGEDRLEEAVNQGIKQYVILGAGLDTFAFRRPDLLDKIEVFELDHPSTQEYKQKRIKELKWELRKQLHFIPIDFNREHLAAKLTDSSYDPTALAFFSWLGVTYYLPRDVVLAVLRSITVLAPKDSVVVFDYLDTDAFNPEKAAQRVQMLLWLANQEQESMQAGFDHSDLAGDLFRAGLHLKEDLGPADIQTRYFQNREDRYYACEHEHLAYTVID
ncbi:MAG TPA: class I SAM-dependent methyltransferase [Syntrophomonadaceae bacterium]|nr:class I SAM-dependent methyltransferase [Syntrophomonadaceae bacterium]